jgi:hypothetical protein
VGCWPFYGRQAGRRIERAALEEGMGVKKADGGAGKEEGE